MRRPATRTGLRAVRGPRIAHRRVPRDEVRQLFVAARARLVMNPRSQYGPLAIAWELRRMGVDPIPPRWTIERVINTEGLARPRRRQAGYVSKGVPYPCRVDPEPGTTHQIDMVGPRHLDGGVEFHALNLIDVGSHAAGSRILTAPRPVLVAAAGGRKGVRPAYVGPPPFRVSSPLRVDGRQRRFRALPCCGLAAPDSPGSTWLTL